ncbi:ATP-binding protein [Phytohabitans sp. ZYX-F-186]|uniref:ATP-binding protein n=1 Tax=Phytohabitans maris TaxID=3071409 RepID=A0ABU0ZCF0_9ACTN|nr:ATP-binding protein [Phytohabitans sp. ZYX-F-186]MDQ7904751.1 ATP-binding protein [Phytohabitans sp. ZYX-F-186]
MDTVELRGLVTLLRARATDLTDLEAKTAVGGLPKSVRETISAFSNGRGGTILLGLDERADFAVAEGFQAARIRDDLASACSSDLEPPVRAEIDIVDIGEGAIVVAEIPELDPRFKPCFVRSRGEYNGSFTRGGDGDRKLTDFEIHLLHTNRGQPDDDRRSVDGASVEDLDGLSVSYLLRRVRQRQRRAFDGLDDEGVLRRLNVLAPDVDGRLVPTLGGMLALGQYPQQFFPQLNATFVVYPGVSAEDVPAGGPRFLDNRTFEGSIPNIVDEAVAAVLRNTSVRSFVEGAGRRDVYDYPVEALREVIVNALVHRDYSPYSRGTPVQIVLYADRLAVANPGGLFGAVTEDDLGGEGVSSTRNPVLVKLLQDVQLPDSDRTVCENRASGIPTMLREMRRAGSAPPEFHNRITRFKVVFPRHALLTAETMAWIEGLGATGLTATQQMALAQLHEGRAITNQSMRNLGLDGRRATVELADLVGRGLAARIGERRHARYVLVPSAGRALAEASQGDREGAVLAALSGRGEMSRRDIELATGLGQITVLRALESLIAVGKVEATAPPRSPLRRYRRI